MALGGCPSGSISMGTVPASGYRPHRQRSRGCTHGPLGGGRGSWGSISGSRGGRAGGPLSVGRAHASTMRGQGEDGVSVMVRAR